jgi:hypothetical protein
MRAAFLLMGTNQFPFAFQITFSDQKSVKMKDNILMLPNLCKKNKVAMDKSLNDLMKRTIRIIPNELQFQQYGKTPIHLSQQNPPKFSTVPANLI